MKKLLLLSALGIFAVSNAAFADITPVVRAGSSPARIAEVQAALNHCTDVNLVVDGVWGSRTTAATRQFQRENFISPVGFVGNRTAAALNECVDGVNLQDEDDTPLVNNNNNTNNNNTNPVLCPNGNTLASNCSLPPVQVNPNQALCPNGNTILSNCTIAPNGVNNQNQLSGTQGTLVAINKLGYYNNTKVSEGDRDIQVFGIEAIARDADQRIDGFIVSFYNSNSASSKKITHYASDISIWLDGVEIGRKSASQYSDESGDTYTYRFVGMNGIIRRDQKSQLVVAISGNNTMDSLNADNDAWKVSAGSSTTASNDGNFISAGSANGHYRDYGNDSTGSQFTSVIDFQKAGGSSSSQRYRVFVANNSPAAQVVQVSNTAPTNDVLLLAFDVKAENGAMLLQRLPVTVSVASAGTGVTPNVEAVVRGLRIYINGTYKDFQSIPTGSSTATVTFGSTGKLNYLLSANQNARIEIRADLEDTESGTGNVSTEFDEGDSVRVDYSSANVSNTLVELNNFNQDTVYNRTGSASGQFQTLRSRGVQVNMGSMIMAGVSTNGSGEVISRTIQIPVTIHAFDDAAFVSQSITNGLTATGNSALAFTFEDAAGNTKIISGYSATFSSSSAPVQSGAYRIDAGSERQFMLTVVVSGNSGDVMNLYKIQLNQVQTFSDALLSSGATAQDLVPANAFETAPFTLTLN